MPLRSDGTVVAQSKDSALHRSNRYLAGLPVGLILRRHGIIALTLAAEIALQSLPRDRTSEAVNQTDEREQVRDAQRGPPARVQRGRRLIERRAREPELLG